MILAIDVDWTYIQQNLIDWSFQGYYAAIGFFVWPLIFTGVIGYIYLKQESAVSAAVAAIILFAAFGGYLLSESFVHVNTWIIVMQLLVTLAITGLVVVFLTKLRR